MQEYRINVAQSDRVLKCAPTLQKLLDTMKRAVDPTGTLAPGRYGIGLPP